jgi:hypothetical protein
MFIWIFIFIFMKPYSVLHRSGLQCTFETSAALADSNGSSSSRLAFDAEIHSMRPQSATTSADSFDVRNCHGSAAMDTSLGYRKFIITAPSI